MPVGLLGRKVGMTQVFNEDGKVVPVTVVEAGPCVVTQVRTEGRDGYEAVQVGFLDKPRRNASRAERGHVADIGSARGEKRKAAGVEAPARPNCEPKRHYREFRTDGESHGLEVGQELTVEHFGDVKRIDVSGTSKGRGFTGQMKRHNFGGQRASHGVKRVHRHGGSIGQSADPARVLKGTRMAGQYGNERVTVRYLEVVRVDTETNTLLLKGAVPGPNGGLLELRHTTKNKYKKAAA